MILWLKSLLWLTEKILISKKSSFRYYGFSVAAAMYSCDAVGKGACIKLQYIHYNSVLIS